MRFSVPALTVKSFAVPKSTRVVADIWAFTSADRPSDRQVTRFTAYGTAMDLSERGIERHFWESIWINTSRMQECMTSTGTPVQP
jgi:hypothetical protein